MKKVYRSPEEILSRELITKTDIIHLLGVGDKKASELFKKVQAAVERDGKINVPGRISWRRMYRMLGLPAPQVRREIKAEVVSRSAENSPES